MVQHLCYPSSSLLQHPSGSTFPVLEFTSPQNIQFGPSHGSFRRIKVVAQSMLTPRKLFQKVKRRKTFSDDAEEGDKKNWWRLMEKIEETGSAVPVLESEKGKNDSLPRDLIVGTLVRFKQQKKWNLVAEVIEWLRTQRWWKVSEMDLVMLITAYGKQGDFNRAEKLLNFMNKNGFPPNVVSHTALMEAYGKSGRLKNAEAIFRRMQAMGPKPSALTLQIILKIFVEGKMYKEAEEIFESLLNNDDPPLKPDQKMFHMMIYMYKKSGSYEKARKTFSQMADRGVPPSTVTFNSLMSFETNYKEVSNIYDQMQRAGLRPDVVSYASLIKAYGKARREEEALAVFEEMLDAGVRPTHKAYNILVDAFAVSGMVDEAATVMKCMRRDRYTPDLCTYTTMLSAYVNAGDMDGACRFFRRFKEDGLEPNVVGFGTLIKGFGKANDLEKMMEVYEDMVLNGVKANELILTTIMDAFGRNKDFDSAVVWYEEMEKVGVSPDKKANNVLLSLAKDQREKEEAHRVIGLLSGASS